MKTDNDQKRETIVIGQRAVNHRRRRPQERRVPWRPGVGPGWVRSGHVGVFLDEKKGGSMPPFFMVPARRVLRFGIVGTCRSQGGKGPREGLSLIHLASRP